MIALFREEIPVALFTAVLRLIITCGIAGGNDALFNVAGEDAFVHRRLDCGTATCVEADSRKLVVFHPDAVERHFGVAASGPEDEDAAAAAVGDHRVRNGELTGAGRNKKDSVLGVADNAVLHMQGSAGDEADGEIVGAAHIDGESAQRDDGIGDRLHVDGGAIEGGVDDGLDPVGDDADRLGDDQRAEIARG